VRVVRWLLLALVGAALGAFLVALLAPRRRVASAELTYTAPPPAEDESVSVDAATPL
jgi:hypothetical protein